MNRVTFAFLCASMLFKCGCGQVPDLYDLYTGTEPEPAAACADDRTVLAALFAHAPTRALIPIPGRPPITVSVELWIQNVAMLRTGAFRLDFYMNLYWADPALSYEHLRPCKASIQLDTELLERIWTPDVVVTDGAHVAVVKAPVASVFTLLYPNGTVWLDYRATALADCSPPLAADRARFPLADTTRCGATLEAWSHPLHDVYLRWTGQGATVFKQIEEPAFVLTNLSRTSAVKRYKAGHWGALRVELHMRRRYGHYIVRYYAPTFLIVAVSWLQLCLGPRPLAGRAFVAVGALLALVTVALAEGATVPKAADIRALDVWIWGCVLFALANMAQFCIVGWLVGRSVAHSAIGECTEMDKVVMYKHCVRALCIDKVNLVLMPALFALFVVLYWTAYAA